MASKAIGVESVTMYRKAFIYLNKNNTMTAN
jgi:hypothetical protein